MKVNKINRRLFGVYSTGSLAPESSECREKLARELGKLHPLSGRAKSAFYCEAGSCAFWITWDGRMLPCGAMEEPDFRPLEIGFDNAWKSITRACGKIPACQECRSCELLEHCNVCPAKLKSETGSYDRPAPYLCELTRISKEKYQEFYDNDDILKK